MDNGIVLSQEEALRVYSLLAARRGDADATLGRLLERLEHHIYRTLTIEEIERLHGGGDRPGSAR